MNTKDVRHLVEINGKLFMPYDILKEEKRIDGFRAGEKREWFKKVTGDEQENGGWDTSYGQLRGKKNVGNWEKNDTEEEVRTDDEGENPFKLDHSLIRNPMKKGKSNPPEVNFLTNRNHYKAQPGEGNGEISGRREIFNPFQDETEEREIFNPFQDETEEREVQPLRLVGKGERIKGPPCFWCGSEGVKTNAQGEEEDAGKDRILTEFLKEYSSTHSRVNGKIKELKIERQLTEALEMEMRCLFEKTHKMEEGEEKRAEECKLEINKLEIKQRIEKVNEKQARTNVLKERERKSMLKIIKAGGLKAKYEKILKTIRANDE